MESVPIDNRGMHHVLPVRAGNARLAGRAVDASRLQRILTTRNRHSGERFGSVDHEPDDRAVKERLDPDGVIRELYEKLNRVG